MYMQCDAIKYKRASTLWALLPLRETICYLGDSFVFIILKKSQILAAAVLCDVNMEKNWQILAFSVKVLTHKSGAKRIHKA